MGFIFVVKSHSFLQAVSDCVLFYYLMKKTVNYKVLARKHTLKPRKPKSGRGHAQQQVLCR